MVGEIILKNVLKLQATEVTEVTIQNQLLPNPPNPDGPKKILPQYPVKRFFLSLISSLVATVAGLVSERRRRRPGRRGGHGQGGESRPVRRVAVGGRRAGRVGDLGGGDVEGVDDVSVEEGRLARGGAELDRLKEIRGYSYTLARGILAIFAPRAFPMLP